MELINMITDKREEYKVLSGAGAAQLKDEVGTVIKVDKICQHVTERDGEDVVCTSILDTEGIVHQSLSPTIDKCCQNLVQIFGLDGIPGLEVVISEGTSNSGRNFLTLEVV